MTLQILKSRFKSKAFTIAATVMLAIQISLMFSFAENNSPTTDEPIHLMGGINYLKNRDFILNPESGIFPQVIAALPNIGSIKIPPPETMASTPHESMPRHVLYPALCNAGLDSVFLKGRMMIGLLNIATGLMILFIAKKVFGNVPSICAFALYAFFPLFISNGTLTTADMAATFAFFLACAAYWTLFRKLSVKTILFAAAASFLLCISKFSAALMGPVAILFIVCKLILKSPLKISLPFLKAKYYQAPRRLAAYALSIILTGLIVWGAIWAAYFFRFDMYHNGAAPVGKPTLEQYVGNSFVQKAAGFAAEHRLLPEGFVYGFLNTYYFSRARWSFLNGEVSMTGFRSYFPQAFLMKTPPPIIAAMIIGVIACAFAMKSRFGRRRLICILPFIMFSLVYVASALTSHLNIGFRHLMPAFPGLFLICAVGFRYLWLNSNSLVKAIPILLAVYCASEALYASPAQISYFSPLYGGSSEGYNHLVDSSFDWGQDFRRIQPDLEKNGIATDGSQMIYLAYFGTNFIDMATNVKCRIILVPICGQNSKEFYEFTGGTYCISATILQGVNLQSASIPLPPSAETAAKLKNDFYFLLDRQKKMGDSMWTGLEEKEMNSLLAGAYNFQLLRFERLRSILVRTKPDFMIGQTILAYNISDEDIKLILGSEYAR